jgi:gliding motility-associated protein GldM
MTVPPSQSGEKRAQDHKGWTTNYFHMTPTIAALTILSKFQNDVKNSEAAITDYCHQKIGQVKVVFDEFQALAQASSNYVMPGDDIEITAGVGAFSAAAKPKITIGGQLISVGNEGTAVWKGKAAGSGMKSIPVRIEFTKPDGTNAIVNREVKYEVGQPAGVAVSADKMNVFYIGVDNPVTITAGVGAEKIKASFSGGSIARSNGAHWIVKPTTPGEHNVNVIIEGKSTPIKFRVKYLPNPASFVGGSKGGSISAAQFKAMGGVIAKYEETDFEASFKVVSYTLAALGGSIPNYTEAQNDGNRWTGRAADIVNRAGPGSNIFLDKIIVVGPDGRRRELAPMVFNLR